MPKQLDLRIPHERHSELDDEERLRRLAAREMGVHPDAIQALRVIKRSLDARGKRLLWQLAVRVWLQGEEVEAAAARVPPRLPQPEPGAEPVIVVGAGPAGLFAALALAEARVPVVLLERGKPVQARRRDLRKVTRGIGVDPDSNYCYGEGGAGTYSDGKLYTRSGKREEIDEVLRVLVAHGAPPDILIDARPHIGSNRLPQVVEAIRATLLAAGVDVRFEARMEDLLRDERGAVAGVVVSEGGARRELAARRVILATGHGARDVLRVLHARGVALEAKPFAMGVRIEHPQELVDGLQYGRACSAGRSDGLPAAAYAVTATVDGRGVYSFCMCPGGWIVPAMTEEGALVLNGMSLSRRDSPFANSGMVVGIEPDDLVGAAGQRWGVAELGLESPRDLAVAGPLWSLEVQAALERRAWDAGGGAHRAPAQRLVDFLAGRVSESLPACSYRPGLTSVYLDTVLPAGLRTRLRDGLRIIARKMPGYLHEDAVMLAVESRTSSPVRIPRDARTLASSNCPGLYPCGEGAGFAGGIVSAALDGRHVAQAILAAAAV